MTKAGCDSLTTAELQAKVREQTQDIVDRADDAAAALGVDTSDETVAHEEAADDVASALGDVLTRDDYLATTSAPTFEAYSSSGVASGAFERAFRNGKQDLLNAVITNPNAFTRRNLESIVIIIDELDELLAQLASETARIAAAAAAGLLVSPSRSEVSTLRDSAQAVFDESRRATTDLRAAATRRTAARRLTGEDELVPPAQVTTQITTVPDRYLEQMSGVPQPESQRNDPTNVSSALATAVGNTPGLSRDASARGRAAANLAAANKALREGVLERAGYIAICMVISTLSTSDKTRARALRAWTRLRELVSALMATLEDGFLASVQDSLQELAADVIDGIADELQNRLDAFDTWLSLSRPATPTFVSTVESVGDEPGDIPVLESLAAQCGLNLSSFCDTHGLLEIAKSLDAQLGLVAQRDTTAVGRARLTVLAPEEEDYRPPTPRPDSEAALLLQENVSPSSTTVVASFPRSGSRNAIASVVSDSFVGAFAPNAAIGGGPGRLAIEGEGETRQVLDYSSSSFDSATGRYTFVIDTGSTPLDPGAPTHLPQVLGRPHPRGRELMYKTSALLTRAERFNVVGNEVTHATNANFDFTANGLVVIDSAQDFDSSFAGGFRLHIGGDDVAVELDGSASVLTGGNTKLVLKADFHGGDQSLVTLSRAPARRGPGSLAVDVRLDRRQRDDLGVSSLAIGSVTGDVSGRVVVDGGGGSRKARSETTAVSTVSAAIEQVITLAAPIVRGDEPTMNSGVGALIEVQGGTSMLSSTVVGVNVAARQIRFRLPQFAGTVTITGGVTVTPSTWSDVSGQLFVGDYVHIIGAGTAKITGVDTAAEEFTIGTSLTNVAGAAMYSAVPPGSSSPRAVTVTLEPRETLAFSSVRRVDNENFELNLAQATIFAHGLQELELTPTVTILPSTNFQAYRAAFSVPAETVRPRFTNTAVPLGATVIRAEFDDAVSETLLGGIVAGATEIIAPNGARLAVTPPADVAGGVYAFTLTDPLALALPVGSVIEVETTNVFSQLSALFPDDDSWATPIDSAFSAIGDALASLESKLCALLSGRPQDMLATATLLTASIAAIRLALSPIRITVATMPSALPSSDTVAKVKLDFENNGMDAAAEAVDLGDVIAITELTPTSATSEGRAREALECYREELALLEEQQVADRAVAFLRGREFDKALLAEVRRPFRDSAKAVVQRQRDSSQSLAEDVEQIT